MDTITQQVRRVTHITLIVKDQDATIDFYSKAFGTEIRSDQQVEFEGHAMRWVTIGIPGDALEIAVQEPMAMPGQEPPKAGDNNMTVVEVGDIDAACTAWTNAGGAIAMPVEELPWGKSAVVRDLDGNPWNFVQPPN